MVPTIQKLRAALPRTKLALAAAAAAIAALGILGPAGVTTADVARTPATAAPLNETIECKAMFGPTVEALYNLRDPLEPTFIDYGSHEEAIIGLCEIGALTGYDMNTGLADLEFRVLSALDGETPRSGSKVVLPGSPNKRTNADGYVSVSNVDIDKPFRIRGKNVKWVKWTDYFDNITARTWREDGVQMSEPVLYVIPKRDHTLDGKPKEKRIAGAELRERFGSAYVWSGTFIGREVPEDFQWTERTPSPYRHLEEKIEEKFADIRPVHVLPKGVGKRSKDGKELTQFIRDDVIRYLADEKYDGDEAMHRQADRLRVRTYTNTSGPAEPFTITYDGTSGAFTSIKNKKNGLIIGFRTGYVSEFVLDGIFRDAVLHEEGHNRIAPWHAKKGQMRVGDGFPDELDAKAAKVSRYLATNSYVNGGRVPSRPEVEKSNPLMVKCRREGICFDG